jgi:hypothetical protein
MKNIKKEQKYVALLALVMLATLRHSASIYLSISPYQMSVPVLNWIYGIAVVSVLDIVVIVFTLEGSKLLPKVFGVGLSLLTLAYFLNIDIISKIIGIGVFTALLPLAGYEFAELFTKIRTSSDAEKLRTDDIKALQDKLNVLENLVENQETAEQIEALIHTEIQQVKQDTVDILEKCISPLQHNMNDAIPLLDRLRRDYAAKDADAERKRVERSRKGGNE